ncbi:MAG: hypothetical protein KDB61_04300, partial [Planctomycetes bacterium]|nr:hypothetical protein [Planctomycetota bacterium]
RVIMYRRVAGYWMRDQIIRNPDPNSSSDHFGKSVALRNGRLVVGNPDGNAPGTTSRCGSAHVFERNASGFWEEVSRLGKSSDTDGNSSFGISVALGEDYVVVGDRKHRVGGSVGSGAAFAYELPFGDGVCSGAVNSLGNLAWLEVLGSHRAARGLLRLRAGDLIPGQLVMFLVGESSGYVPNPGNSAGALCLGGRIGRFDGPGQIGPADAAGLVELSVDTGALPVTPSAPILAGESWTFQCWYRDTQPTTQSNFSGAVEVLFE